MNCIGREGELLSINRVKEASLLFLPPNDKMDYHEKEVCVWGGGLSPVFLHADGE